LDIQANMGAWEPNVLNHRSRNVSTAVLAVCCVLLAPMTGAADPADPRPLIDLVREEDERRETRWTGFHRIRAGYPQTVSAGLGVIRARLPESWECVTSCPFRGLVLQVEPGIRGIQLSAGFATMIAEKNRLKHFLHDIDVAFGVKGVVLHRWDRSEPSAAQRTFAGVEFSYTVTRINFSIGTLRRIDRIPGGDWLVSAGFGWGF
jgi:hypothetical protein